MRLIELMCRATTGRRRIRGSTRPKQGQIGRLTDDWGIIIDDFPEIQLKYWFSGDAPQNALIMPPLPPPEAHHQTTIGRIIGISPGPA